MTSFVCASYPSEHPGVVRAERVAAELQGLWRRAPRGSLLVAAAVSALLVVVGQVIDSWSDGHLLAAWVLMWAIAFGAMALLAAPARDAALRLRAGVARWNTARRQAVRDRGVWEAAQADPRVMIDLRCAVYRARSASGAD